ncbi:Uncharacterised protein [Yersinia intermedia]|uniref:Uncharacterized protein n=1 Tax=Yersinia intermedia TaxID=631 RepID=A0A0H5MFW8_YERIN|nr:hypothetical protein [Yersinia intermedia]CRY55966.1 Uncharacterised protein [Yersinia intermedia]
MNTHSQESTLSATTRVESIPRVSDLMPFRYYKPQVHLAKNPTSSKLPHVHNRPNREITKPDETIGNNNIYKVHQGGGCREIYLGRGSIDNTIIFERGITFDMLHFEKSWNSNSSSPRFKISVRDSQSNDSVIFRENLDSIPSREKYIKNISVNGQIIPMEGIRTALLTDKEPVWPVKKTPPAIDQNELDALREKYPNEFNGWNSRITHPDKIIGSNKIYQVNQRDGGREIFLIAGSRDNTLKFGSGITADMLHFEKSSRFSSFFPRFKISLRGSQSDDSVIITESLNSHFALSSQFKDISVDGQTLPMETIRTALRKNEQPVWLAKETPPVLDNKVVPVVEKITTDTLQTTYGSPAEIQMLTNAMASFGENGLVSFSKDVISDVASNIFRGISTPHAFRFLMTTL